jgi:polysaccharide export outer membrane protein
LRVRAASGGTACVRRRLRGQHADLVAFLRAHENEISSGEYRVSPPDSIRIHAATAPEIDGITQRIRSDGKVALRLVGEVQVAGMTPEETAGKIQEILARYYVEPQVMVEVVEYKSKTFFVLGQVEAPRPYPYTGRDTLLSAIATAKPNFIAWMSQVKVVRPSPDGEQRHVVTVDMDKMIQQGDVTQNFLLQEGDIVFVPPTPLGWLGLRVREVLFPLSPVIQAYTLPTAVKFANDVYQGDTDE